MAFNEADLRAKGWGKCADGSWVKVNGCHLAADGTWHKAANNAPRLPAAVKEQDQAAPLASGKARKRKSKAGSGRGAYKWSFIYCRSKPIDVRNHDTKDIEDWIVRAGIVPDDSPRYVNDAKETQIKVDKGQEMTVIEIEYL